MTFKDIREVTAVLNPDIQDWSERMFEIAHSDGTRKALRVAGTTRGWTPLSEALEELGNDGWEAVTTFPMGVANYSGIEYGLLFKRLRAT